MEIMNDGELQHLHKVLLMIAQEIDRVCVKNGITYTLTGGSMLGAIRHKGFIPWDDDMDIAMLRTDYERFLNACKTDLSDQFILQTMETDKNYFYGFAKILLKGTYCVQFGQERTKHQKGIYIDIFPLDNIPSSYKLRVKQARKNYLLIKLLSRKAGCEVEDKGNIKKVIGFKIIDIMNICTRFDYLRISLERNMKRFNNETTEMVCNLAGYYGYEKESTFREYFEDIEYVPFEDTRLPIISKYHEYLTAVYGNYMELPPVDKRHTHGFQSLHFGPF